MVDSIQSSFSGNLSGTTGNQQNLYPQGNDMAGNSFLGTNNASPEGNGKVGDIDTVTGLINRIINRTLVDTWSYDIPYLKFMREVETDMAKKVVQITAPKILPGQDFDPLDGSRLTQRKYAENVQAQYMINFTRQYLVTVNKDLLERGASLDAVYDLVGQQIANLKNQKNIEVAGKINDVISDFIINNQDKLYNIQFNPQDPENPTVDELNNLSAKIDKMNMAMTRFVNAQFSISEVGYITNPNDIVIDTVAMLPAQLRNKVFPYAFNSSSFTYSGEQPKDDGSNSNKINVLEYLPKGVWGFVRDKNMLSMGVALSEINPDMTGLPYNRSYNVVHNFWASIFMDVFKRGYMISTLPDSMPQVTTVELSGISAKITNQLGDTITKYSLSNPVGLNLVVTPTGKVSPQNKNVNLPSQHKVTITISDSDGNAVKKLAKTNVDDLDRLNFQNDLQSGYKIIYNVESTYTNPSATLTGKAPDKMTTSTTLSVTD